MGDIISIKELQDIKRMALQIALDISIRDLSNLMHIDLAPEKSEERTRRFKKWEEELGTPVIGSLEDILNTLKI